MLMVSVGGWIWLCTCGSNVAPSGCELCAPGDSWRSRSVDMPVDVLMAA